MRTAPPEANCPPCFSLRSCGAGPSSTAGDGAHLLGRPVSPSAAASRNGIGGRGGSQGDEAVMLLQRQNEALLKRLRQQEQSAAEESRLLREQLQQLVRVL